MILLCKKTNKKKTVRSAPLNKAIGLKRLVPLYPSRAGGEGDCVWRGLLCRGRGLGAELTQGASAAAQETGASFHADKIHRKGP